MLFKINTKDSIFKLNPELKGVPEFADLNDKQMKVVAFMADYKSPFRQKPVKERWRLAFLAAGYKVQEGHNNTFDMRAREIEAGKNEKVNAALAKYKEMQHNEDIELLDIIQTQMDNIKQMVRKGGDDPNEMKKLNDLLLTLPDLRKTQRSLAESANLDYEFETDGEKKQQNISTIDKLIMDEQGEV